MKLSETQQKNLLYIILGKEAIDFISGGKITKAGRDLVVGVLRRGNTPRRESRHDFWTRRGRYCFPSWKNNSDAAPCLNRCGCYLLYGQTSRGDTGLSRAWMGIRGGCR